MKEQSSSLQIPDQTLSGLYAWSLLCPSYVHTMIHAHTNREVQPRTPIQSLRESLMDVETNVLARAHTDILARIYPKHDYYMGGIQCTSSDITEITVWNGHYRPLSEISEVEGTTSLVRTLFSIDMSRMLMELSPRARSKDQDTPHMIFGITHERFALFLQQFGYEIRPIETGSRITIKRKYDVSISGDLLFSEAFQHRMMNEWEKSASWGGFESPEACEKAARIEALLYCSQELQMLQSAEQFR